VVFTDKVTFSAVELKVSDYVNCLGRTCSKSTSKEVQLSERLVICILIAHSIADDRV